MRVAVIGHVEWIEFARVRRVPKPGDIVHALETWQEPGGAGAVAAVQLVKLAGSVTLYSALGDDELGHRAKRELEGHGVRVEATFRPRRQRRGFTYLDDDGERTITTIGPRLGADLEDPLDWAALRQTDAVYFVAGDAGALRVGRSARVLVATSRVMADLEEARVPLDAVVGSGLDPDERYEPGRLVPQPSLVVLTAGADGGTWEAADGTSGAFPPAPLPGPRVDSYGCGDSFAAGLTFGLGAGYGLEGALDLAARCGAACMTGRGPYPGQLRLSPPA